MNQQKVADALNQSWVYRLLPQSAWPYAQLARWERPIGWQLLLWPCLWSLGLAANYYSPEFFQQVHSINQRDHQTYPIMNSGGGADWVSVLFYLVLFVAGAIVMRGAGCTYNDLVDQNIDDKVARTRSRPLPSGRVTRRSATIFLVLQLLAGLCILLQFNNYAIVVGLASILTIIIYPFMKRITWWPQLFLGFAFSWGALMGWSAVAGILYPPAIALYIGSICWVIGYDTIYAHQDIEDDMLANVKSTARLFGQNTKAALIFLYGGALIFIALSYYLTKIAWPAWMGLAAGAAHMVWQLRMLDIEDPEQCLRLFKSNNIFGMVLFAGLVTALALSAVQ